MTPAKLKTKHCQFYAQGLCERGDACTYIHDPVKQQPMVATDTSASLPPAAPPTAPPTALSTQAVSALIDMHSTNTLFSEPQAKPKPQALNQPATPSALAAQTLSAERKRAATLARAQLEAREQALAAREHVEHVRERTEWEALEGIEREEHEHARAKRQALERTEREARECTQREARERAEAAARERQRALEEQERVRQEQQAQRDAAKTIQRVVLGSIVTYGAGLDIRGFTTGFESCVVRVRGLPEDALEREIYALFTQQGIDQARLYLTMDKLLPNGTREVKMAMDAESGHALSVGLNELEFRDRRLSFEVGSYNIPGAMGASGVKDVEVLTISWQAMTLCYVATYGSFYESQLKIEEISGSVHFGRRLTAEAIIPSADNRILAARVAPHSVKIDNIPASMSYEDIVALAGPEALSLHSLPSRGVANHADPLELVRRTVRLSGRSDDDILSLERSETAADTLMGYVRARARFRTWEQAKTVHDYMTRHNLIGGVRCHVVLPSPLAYVITIPSQQHTAQRTQWDSLQSAARVVDKSQCSFVQVKMQNDNIVRFRITGSDKKTVGALKLRVEALAAGERVVGWHTQLGQHSNGIFAARVLAESGAFMRADWRQRQIKLYGSPQAVECARAMVADELDRLAGLEYTTRIPPTSVRYFLERGLPELHELLGADNARFNPVTRSLTTSGGDSTQHIVLRILEQAAVAKTILPIAGEDVCPICLEIVSVPVRLGCGHSYCSTCLQHFVTSAADSDKFPLVCMGDEARCNVPIAIPYIERFLSNHMLVRLLETTFRVHISQHPAELKYCRTPNCEQIYRVAPQGGPRPSPVQCPACLSSVCPMCHSDGHEGMTCAEHRAHNSPEEQERLLDEYVASQNGRVQRCPRCRVPTEKTEGCNHMECRCGAHFCWICLGVFASGEIYRHMDDAHGGMNAGEPVVNANLYGAGVNYAEQENLLRQAVEARRPAEARREAIRELEVVQGWRRRLAMLVIRREGPRREAAQGWRQQLAMQDDWRVTLRAQQERAQLRAQQERAQLYPVDGWRRQLVVQEAANREQDWDANQLHRREAWMADQRRQEERMQEELRRRGEYRRQNQGGSCTIM